MSQASKKKSSAPVKTDAPMTVDIDELYTEFEKQLGTTKSEAEVLKLKSDYIGKEGQLSLVLRTLKGLSPEQRKDLGSQANLYKGKIEDAVQSRIQSIHGTSVAAKLEQEWVDVTLRGSNLEQGLDAAGYHPLSRLQRQLENVFLSMGFEVLDGPHIEDDFHNFEALNIPPDHPARDMTDTFWFADKIHLLRTHTSPVQIRGMLSRKPPLRFIAPGKTFRCERTDASHEAAFHQLEGMMVDEGINIGHLTYFAAQLFSAIFEREVKIRTRPSYFPFVEPGLEIDLACTVCDGKGCSVCRQSGWLEMMGAGLVHPKVLLMGKIDPQKYSGFAFGLGLDRLLMMRHGIDDIRHLHSGDLRFVSQFRSF